MPYKEILSITAIVLTFIAIVPYIRSVRKGKTKPHVFSWVIWGMTTLVVFFAQIADKGGAGAWPIGVSALLTIYVAVLAYMKKADITVTRIDWAFFIMAILSLPLWYFTADPLWAVVILTFVDTLGFGPTFKKSWYYPFEEQLTLFVIMVVRNALAIMALEHYSLTTILFPAAIVVTCMTFIPMVLYRRQIVNSY